MINTSGRYFFFQPPSFSNTDLKKKKIMWIAKVYITSPKIEYGFLLLSKDSLKTYAKLLTENLERVKTHTKLSKLRISRNAFWLTMRHDYFGVKLW